MKFFVQILTNALAIILSAYLIPGFIFTGNPLTLLLAGLILGLINFFLKPILKFISAPLIIVTLGLFIIIINIFLLWLLDYLVMELTIVGFWAYFWGTIVIGLVNIAFGYRKK